MSEEKFNFEVNEAMFPSPEAVEASFGIKRLCPEGSTLSESKKKDVDQLYQKIVLTIGFLQFEGFIYNNYKLVGEEKNIFCQNYIDVFGSLLEGLLKLALLKREDTCRKNPDCPMKKKLQEEGIIPKGDILCQAGHYCQTVAFFERSKRVVRLYSDDTFEDIIKLFRGSKTATCGIPEATPTSPNQSAFLDVVRRLRNSIHLDNTNNAFTDFTAKLISHKAGNKSKHEIISDLVNHLLEWYEKEGAICHPNLYVPKPKEVIPNDPH
jgi:hypothetical protein